MAQPGPSFELRATSIAEVSELFAKYHPYKSTGNCAVYAFAVFENNTPIAAYIWQPPPPGAAKSAFAAMPAGVLALSRMVAVPRSERRLQHVSKPLRWQMKNRIDRTRWPVLITYSDESVGHTGHVYLCSGWQKTKRRKAPTYTTADGRRVSSYSDGRHLLALPEGVVRGTAFIQRWENWGGLSVEEASAVFLENWERVPVPGKKWNSGKPAYRYERRVENAHEQQRNP